METIISDLLKLLKVRHTKYFLNKLYDGHPHNNDLYGLQDMLKSYGIKTIGVHFKDKEEAELTFPCVLCLENQFVIGLNCTEETISYLSDGVFQEVTISHFNGVWTGNALLLEDYEKAKEPQYSVNIKNELCDRMTKYGVIGLPLLLILSYSICHASWNNFFQIPLLLLHTIGLFICYLLLQRQIETASLLGDKICSLVSRKGCKKVTESKAAYILHNISWSEIGYAYFLSSMIVELCFPACIFELTIINAAAMLYGIWSVYYQSKVARSWCLLCLLAQIVVWLSGTYLLVLWQFNMNPSAFSFMSFLTILLLISLNVLLVHDISLSRSMEREMRLITREKNSFKMDKDVFRIKYGQTPKHSDPQHYSNVILGNSSVDTHLTILINPHCEPCERLHERLESLLAEYDHEISFRLIFIDFNEALEKDSKYLIAVWLQKDSETVRHIYKEWFRWGRNNVKTFQKRYLVNMDDDRIDPEHKRHKKWVEATGLKSTPMIFFHDHEIPSNYTIEEVVRLEEEK